MKKIKKIAHLADIHIRKKLNRHEEYRTVFSNLYESLNKNKPDLIVVVGDLFHDFVEHSNEAKVLAGEFLNNLSLITDVIITQGNHDLMKKSPNRLDSVETIIKLINNPKVTYYNNTGFYNYEDTNVIFSVWHHIDKYSPWGELEKENRNTNFYSNDIDSLLATHKTIGGIKENGYCFIDLFHDPIQDCKLPNGETMSNGSLVKTTDFKGDYLLAGDIHLRDIYERDGKVFGGYSGSLIQQGFGEKVENHGYLLWDIENREVSAFDMQNDYAFINVYLKTSEKKEIDYDTLNFKIKCNNPDTTEVKVHWTETASKQNRENEWKIKNYIKNTFSIKQVKFNKITLNDLKIELNEGDERLKNIEDKSIQQEIFVEYLKENKYTDETISEVINLDNQINERLNLIDGDEHKYSEYSIEKLWIDNFKSYGSDIYVPFTELNGITQVNGKNRQGKSTLLSAIWYLIWGKTIDTQDKEKFGDNRYINHKRDLDYCEVKGVININGEHYLIIRRTERTFKRNGIELSSCSTTVVYHKCDSEGNVIGDTNENEELSRQTTKLIEKSVGSFEDNVRSSLLTADNLNDILSEKRANFIDSLLRDSGLDIFEKKLDLFKEYKKEKNLQEENIILNVEDTELIIQSKEESIINLENDIKSSEVEIDNLSKKIDDLTKQKEATIKKLHPINNELLKHSEETLKDGIQLLFNQKQIEEDKIEVLNTQIMSLKDTYDIDKLNSFTKQKEDFNEWTYSKKGEIRDIKSKMETISSNGQKINGDVELIKREIKNIEDAFENKKQSLLNSIELAKGQVNNKIQHLTQEIANLEKSKLCPTCDREYGSEQISLIQSKISNKQKEIETLNNDLLDPNFGSEFLNKINEEAKLKEINILEKEDLIKTKLESKKPLQLEYIELQNKIPLIEKEIEVRTLEIEDLNIDIKKIELDKKEVDDRKLLEVEKNQIPLKIENLMLRIESGKKLLADFKENHVKIVENTKIDGVINELQNTINEVTIEKTNSEHLKNKLELEINDIKNNITYLKDRIVKFNKQSKRNETYNIYQQCLHRDGVPSRILKNQLLILNNEFNSLLEDMPFSLYFNEDIDLKFNHGKTLSSEQNAITGSGMERTFVAFVLKIALRKINNKIRNNFIMLDELCGKIDEDYYDDFLGLLEKTKTVIDKIFVIEHTRPINYDNVINVYQEEDCSKLEISLLNE